MKNLRSCSQAELLSTINQISFAINDITLYLDTHPNGEAALAYFSEHMESRKELLKEYATRFGSASLLDSRQRELQTVLGLGDASHGLGKECVKRCGIIESDCSFL